ncbi:MAG: thioredoxin domain-containing protein [Candidatus Dependentiae bacterium]|nr:thioredoxin domain-containing protein [Candidatus Dependentiae bacterium]
MKRHTTITQFFAPVMLLSILLIAQPLHAAVVNVTSQAQFDTIIKDARPALIKFSAGWCGACTGIKKPFEDLAKDKEFSNVQFVQVDIDADANKTVAQKYGVVGIPTVIYVENGVVKNKEVGVKDPSSYKDSVRKNLRTHFGSLKTNIDVPTDVDVPATTSAPSAMPTSAPASAASAPIVVPTTAPVVVPTQTPAPVIVTAPVVTEPVVVAPATAVPVAQPMQHEEAVCLQKFKASLSWSSPKSKTLL